jgi:hypothetical protein
MGFMERPYAMTTPVGSVKQDKGRSTQSGSGQALLVCAYRLSSTSSTLAMSFGRDKIASERNADMALGKSRIRCKDSFLQSRSIPERGAKHTIRIYLAVSDDGSSA